jgi:hypothetical protein
MRINPIVGLLGATFCDVTKPVTEEPLPREMVALLMLLERAGDEQVQRSNGPPH